MINNELELYKLNKYSIYTNKSLDVYNLLQDIRKPKLIIDLRPNEEYNKSHIKSSVNLPPPSTFGRPYNIDEKDGDKILVDFDLATYFLCTPRVNASLKTTKYILVSNTPFRDYSDDLESFVTTSKSKNDTTLLSSDNDIIGNKNSGIVSFKVSDWEQVVLKYLLSTKNKSNLIIYQNGYNQFQSTYPFMCVSMSQQNTERSYASEILENFLYLGNQENSENRKQIENLKITHIVNMAVEIPDKYSHIYKYYRADLDDSPNVDIQQHFQPIIDFINQAKQQNGRVLVHCAMGISRSATVVIAYLMKEFKSSYVDTYNFVESKRSIIHPNFGFVRQLKDYYHFLKQEQFLNNNSINNDKNNTSITTTTTVSVEQSPPTEFININDNNNN